MTDKNELTLSSGIRLRFHPVPTWLVQKIRDQIEDPLPPMRTNPDNGREEEDLGNREYLRKLDAAQSTRREMANNALMHFGVEVLDVPAGFPTADDPVWREEIRVLGFTDINEAMLKVEWLKYYVLRGDAVYVSVIDGVRRLSGVVEADVTEAEASFRSDEERVSDSGAVITNVSPDGH